MKYWMIVFNGRAVLQAPVPRNAPSYLKHGPAAGGGARIPSPRIPSRRTSAFSLSRKEAKHDRIRHQGPRASLSNRYAAIAALSVLALAGGTVGALVTQESRIADNTITITTPDEIREAKVDVHDKPIKLSVKTGQEMEPFTYSYEITNTGNADAEVRITPLEDLVLPRSAEGRAARAHIMAFYRGDGDNPDPHFRQSLVHAVDDQPSFQQPFRIPAGVKTTIDFPDGTDAFLPYQKTFDIAFYYVTAEN